MFLLIKYKVSPHLLELEITERTLVTDSDIPLMICHKLVEQGFVISLDDFGTGYSSLSHIADYPISELKIDRAFISQICESEKTRNIVISIITLANALGIDVVAEGIETWEQYNLAGQLGCLQAQGYYIAKPMHVEILTEQLSATPVNA